MQELIDLFDVIYLPNLYPIRVKIVDLKGTFGKHGRTRGFSPSPNNEHLLD